MLAAPLQTSFPAARPAQVLDAAGRPRVDLRAIIALAAPFAANSAIQAVLNLTDTWFIGHISTSALAAIAAVHWPVIVCIALFGGVGLAGQTLVAQATGGRRYARASQAGWIALWAVFLVAPIFVALGFGGRWLLHPFALAPEIEAQALAFWQPRMYGAPLAVALWGVLGFFNGIGRPQITFAIDLLVAVMNAALNALFIFKLNWGIEGAAWATNCAQACGVLAAIGVFVSPTIHTRFRSHLTWRVPLQRVYSQWKLGFPMGLLLAADMLGFALFQLMQVHLSAVDGAAAQVTIMLTSVAFMPAVGMALASTTLVGQSIGMGDRAWARRLGNTIILLCMGYMGFIGLLLGLFAPWLLPAFVATGDAQAADVIRVGTTIMWIAAAYQIFDGLNLGSSFSLRGAGDANVPAMTVIVLSWFLFVPVAHMLSFAPGQGWVDWLPQFGLGAVGGWLAALIYIFALGVAMWLRWRSAAWEKIRLR
ncbi:MAG TPA: MATE family efflux transporter [Povalibacter sp.]